MTNSWTRRDVLRSGAAAAVALPAAGALAADAKALSAMIPIVDTHQHLWDLKKFKLAWVEEGSPLARSYVSSDYAEATKGLNVVKAVYMEVDVVPEQQTDEAKHLIALIREGKTPTVAAVISGRPASEGFKSYVAQFKDAPEIKGVRQVLHGDGTPAGYCLSKEFTAGIRHLGEKGLMYDICIRPGELGDAAKLIDACPDTKFILDHCGNGDVRAKDRSAWKRDLSAIAERKNVVCKVSGIVASAKGAPWTADDLAPIVNHVLESFGPERVMFGGDWPVCTLAATYRQWIEALQAIVKGRSDADNRKLFHDNAMRVYGLKD